MKNKFLKFQTKLLKEKLDISKGLFDLYLVDEKEKEIFTQNIDLLLKLEKELENFRIDEKVKYKIIKFLSEILNQKELINYHKKNPLIKKIKTFLEQLEEFQEGHIIELQELINNISKAISIILKRIKLRDQFITRMDLIVKDKIKSEEVAKLTSLKGKSHYDVLRERFFFQNIVNWFYEIYKNNKKENDNQV
ncbi:MAG: hypothetical protein V3V33_05375 [Candidatus Lokiarchaeia archaeon]